MRSLILSLKNCSITGNGSDDKNQTTGNSKNKGEKLQDGIDAAVGLVNDVANIVQNPMSVYNYYSAARNAYKLIYASGEAYQEQMSATGSVTYTGTAGIPITVKGSQRGQGSNEQANNVRHPRLFALGGCRVNRLLEGG